MPPRFFRHGELPLLLLWLVSEQPRHGYDLIAELTRLFAPRYRPSPGTIYPALEALEREGLIIGEPHGERVIYQASPTGEMALTERRDVLTGIEVRTRVQLRSERGLAQQLEHLRARLLPLAGRVDADATAAILADAATAIETLAAEAPTLLHPTVTRTQEPS